MIPTVDDTNKVLHGIELYLRHIGYGLQYTEKGPQVGRTARSARQQWNMNNGTLNVFVDVTEDWEWNVKIQAQGVGGGIVWNKGFSEKNALIDSFSKKLKKALLEKLPSNEFGNLTMESVFRSRLLQSTLYIVEKEYDRIFE